MNPLGHDDDPQRLDASSATTEMGSIGGGHRPGRHFMLQALHRDIRPSSAEYIEHLVMIDSLVGDHYQSPVIAAHQSRQAHCAPSLTAPSRPVTDIAQPTSQPLSGVA